jgi:hypothetical protein
MTRNRRFLWLSAGLVTAGVSMAMVAGAGLVPAQTEEATAQAQADESGPADEAVAAAKSKQTSVETALAFAAVEPAAAPTGPTLLNIVGTFFWGLFDLVSKMVDLPPVVPTGSTVTAGRSTLQIDCGDGYTADADWYFPTEGEPDKFIYFQHGFPGRAGFYNLTLTELAERNNAIVVAPSITGNFFACDGCNLTADPMHAAVARLFEGDRAALLASAEAAGYQGALPEKFVISGQSAGGILAAGAAVQVLSQGWITDMYAGRVYDPATRTGIYGVPGDPGETVIDIPTDAGLAHGYVLPGPTPQLTLVDLIVRTVLELPAALNFASCAADPSASAAAATCAAASASPVTAA